MPQKMTGKCCICGKPVFSVRSIYCCPHSHFSARMSDERFSPKTREALWKYVRKHDFTCFYTGQKGLDVFDKSSPYFLEFDHVIPGNPRKIVITSAWFNEMKGDLSIREFKRSNVQLYNYWIKGIKIKKMKFRYWFRLKPPGKT